MSNRTYPSNALEAAKAFDYALENVPETFSPGNTLKPIFVATPKNPEEILRLREAISKRGWNLLVTLKVAYRIPEAPEVYKVTVKKISLENIVSSIIINNGQSRTPLAENGFLLNGTPKYNLKINIKAQDTEQHELLPDTTIAEITSLQ